MKTGVKYRRARQTAWRTIADETVLLDLEHKRMYGLNPAAAAVWLALDDAGGGGGDQAFGEPGVAAFLDELLALGLAEERRLTAADDPEPAAEPPAAAPPDPGPDTLEPPAILWREDVEQIAGTCAFFPSQNPLCDQVPFS